MPFASSWRPGAVALGVVGCWLLAAVEGTSLLMRKLPRKLWRAVHLSSYVLFWTSTAHLLLAGTDARNPIVVASAEVLAGTVLFLTLVAALSPKGTRAVRRTIPTHPQGAL